ncbi:hypothetical protein D3C80_1538330 [compost metagenome]
MRVRRGLEQNLSAGQRKDNIKGNSGVQHGITHPGIKEQGAGGDSQSDPKAGPEIMGRGPQMPFLLGMRIMILHGGHCPQSYVADQEGKIGGIEINVQAGCHNQYKK